MKKAKILSVALAFSMAVSTVVAFLPTKSVKASEAKTVKNVIMLIPDGMSVNATTLARYMLPGNENGKENLFMDEFVVGLVKTSWANGPITDSAPAGTAYAIGYKSLAGSLGVDSNKKPRASLLEAAQLIGKSVGLIATSEFMHATPAAYSSHELSRSNYATVAEQMLNTDLTVLLGSGAGHEKVKDLDVLNRAKEKGFDVVRSKTELESYQGSKLWGDFNNAFGKNTNLSYDLDRAAEEPSLAEMTKKAIEVLSKDEDGFFLMVEGSKIDWAAHANDTIGILSDVAAFNEAFEVAINFAKADGQTAVLAATDHGNSGVSIGSYHLEGYDKAPFSILEPLKSARMTAEGAMSLLDEAKSEDSIIQVLNAYGIDPADESIAAEIQAFKSEPTTAHLVKTMNKKAYIGYTTGGHTGEDVPLYCYVPEGISAPKGLMENTDVARYIEKIMNVDLDGASQALFVDITDDKGVMINAETGIASITSNDKTLVIRANESEATLNGEKKSLDGQVAVYINNRFYIPQIACDLLK